jgi:hypothetical protein
VDLKFLWNSQPAGNAASSDTARMVSTTPMPTISRLDEVQPVGMDLAESVTMPDHRFAVPMVVRVVVIMVVTVILRAGIGPTAAVARLAGFAHGECHKISLRPQHP